MGYPGEELAGVHGVAYGAGCFALRLCAVVFILDKYVRLQARVTHHRGLAGELAQGRGYGEKC